MEMVLSNLCIFVIHGHSVYCSATFVLMVLKCRCRARCLSRFCGAVLACPVFE